MVTQNMESIFNTMFYKIRPFMAYDDFSLMVVWRFMCGGFTLPKIKLSI